ncbi:extracellular solute-binding protein [Mesorhizobium delmotii]|uniref:Sugar binding protein of ABC transporter n=1 Tax=Mesorhizobium delmotii TaxID=1631247 RepID=A0A2P9AGI2_9HYPH
MRMIQTRTCLALTGLTFMMATTAAAETTLRVSYSPATYKELYQDLADRFMQIHPDTKVELEIGSDSYDTLVQQTIRASITGQMPDISYQGLNQIRTLVERKLPVPLDTFIQKEPDWESQGYSTAITNLAAYGGTTYGLPFGISLPVVFYNADLVKQAGGDPDKLPETWEDIIALSKKIDALGDDVSGLYVEYTNNSGSFQTFVGGFGGEMVTSDEASVAFDGDAGEKTMELLHRLGKEGQPPFERNQARQAYAARLASSSAPAVR